VSLFFELIVEVAGQAFLELGWRSLTKGFRSLQRAHPVLSVAALAIAGAFLGWLSVLLLPDRVFGFRGIPGATMVVSPLINGALMEAYGRWCDRRGHRRSSFANFWGGAVFAFGMAAVRFYFVGTGR
jgi:hypothetical protein